VPEIDVSGLWLSGLWIDSVVFCYPDHKTLAVILSRCLFGLYLTTSNMHRIPMPVYTPVSTHKMDQSGNKYRFITFTLAFFHDAGGVWLTNWHGVPTHLTSSIQWSPHPVNMHPERNWFRRDCQIKLFDFALCVYIVHDVQTMSMGRNKQLDKCTSHGQKLHEVRQHSINFWKHTCKSLNTRWPILVLTQNNTSTNTRIDTMANQWSMHNFTTNGTKRTPHNCSALAAQAA
jgi:hypothetical protein